MIQIENCFIGQVNSMSLNSQCQLKKVLKTVKQEKVRNNIHIRPAEQSQKLRPSLGNKAIEEKNSKQKAGR